MHPKREALRVSLFLFGLSPSMIKDLGQLVLDWLLCNFPWGASEKYNQSYGYTSRVTT